MCPNEFCHLTYEFKKYFIILNDTNPRILKNLSRSYSEKPKKVSKDFEYSSGTNQRFLSIKEIQELNF